MGEPAKTSFFLKRNVDTIKNIIYIYMYMCLCVHIYIYICGCVYVYIERKEIKN